MREGRERERKKDDIPANSNRKSPIFPDPSLNDGHLPREVAPGPVEDLMAVAVLDGVEPAIVRVPVVVGRVEVDPVVRVCCHCICTQVSTVFLSPVCCLLLDLIEAWLS